MRILVDGTEAEPADSSFERFAFDSSDSNTESSSSWEGHAVERVLGPLPAGTYTVVVQRWVSDAGLSFWLDDWLLIAEAKLTS